MSRKNNPSHSFEQARHDMADAIRAYQPSPGVFRVEIRIKPIDQLAWLSAQNAQVKIFGADQEDNAAIAGVGEAVALSGNGKVDFTKVFARLRRYLNPAYPYLQWYGGFCFDAAAGDGPWSPLGSWRFILPRFELARYKDKMIFCCNLTAADKAGALKELAVLKPPSPGKGLKLNVRLRRDHPTPQAWRKGVEAVLKDIKAGRCQKVVLARRTDLVFKEKLDPWTMLKTLKKVTPRSYHFAFGLGDTVFLGASPERLYKRHGRVIISEALAGTKAASVAPGVLLRSAKDRHEHQLVVEAIADGLGPLCDQLVFDPKPRIRTLSNGHHLNTRFQGHLKDGVKDEDVLQSLHPTPAVGGVPRDFARRCIRRSESFDRGWYAGPLGYVGLDWAEFVVGIRSGLIKGKELSVFAGAGIVQGSRAGDEWREIENKIGNFIKIIK